MRLGKYYGFWRLLIQLPWGQDGELENGVVTQWSADLSPVWVRTVNTLIAFQLGPELSVKLCSNSWTVEWTSVELWQYLEIFSVFTLRYLSNVLYGKQSYRNVFIGGVRCYQFASKRPRTLPSRLCPKIIFLSFDKMQYLNKNSIFVWLR